MSKNHEGVLIGIEGGDGSGKHTQAIEIVDDLSAQGFNVLFKSYPQYGKPSARYAERYLNGVYGSVNQVHPDLAALAYMMDRADYETLEELREHLSHPENVVVSDRSPASNMAHQGTKFELFEDRLRFYREIVEMEYGVLREPRPDISVILRVPADMAQRNVDSKDASVRTYTTAKRDIHEADANHLNLALRGYNEVADFLPDEFISLDAFTPEYTMRAKDEVHQEIMGLIWARGLLLRR